MIKYWQVAAGSSGRDYSREFLEYGMAFVGGATHRETMKKVDHGDIIILKGGRNLIMAAGTVVERDGMATGDGDKEWLRDFDGWDLSGYCFVRWHVPPQPVQTHGLVRATIQRAHKQHLKAAADRIISQFPPQDDSKLATEPAATSPVKDEEILAFLIKEGLRPALAEDLTSAFKRIRLLAAYYYNECWWEDIGEHEARTFLIMPLLLGLGWMEQQMKVELGVKGVGTLDVACFGRPFSRDSKGTPNKQDCVLILESKAFSKGLDYAPNQVKKYAKSFPSCRVVVVTNGYCYKAYVRDGTGGFSTEPSAYLDVLDPRDRYPLDPAGVAGALELLKYLLPQSWR